MWLVLGRSGPQKIPHVSESPLPSIVSCQVVGAGHPSLGIHVLQQCHSLPRAFPSLSSSGPSRAAMVPSSLKPPDTHRKPRTRWRNSSKKPRPQQGDVLADEDRTPGKASCRARWSLGWGSWRDASKFKLECSCRGKLWNRSPQDNPCSPGAVSSQEN